MLDNQLRFSRKLEQEADRIGMETMVKAGMNPYAMSEMFEAMLHSSRFQSRPPEFLITHPLTESRVSDSKLRAQQYKRKQEPLSLTYQLVRKRAEIANSRNLLASAEKFEAELAKNTLSPEISRYGLALTLQRLGQTDQSETHFKTLLSRSPNNVFYVIGLAELYAEQQKFGEAKALLEPLFRKSPDNHVVNVKYAEVLMKAGDYSSVKKCLSSTSSGAQKTIMFGTCSPKLTD
jgi:predicted Zn-dependent protease